MRLHQPLVTEVVAGDAYAAVASVFDHSAFVVQAFCADIDAPAGLQHGGGHQLDAGFVFSVWLQGLHLAFVNDHRLVWRYRLAALGEGMHGAGQCEFVGNDADGVFRAGQLRTDGVYGGALDRHAVGFGFHPVCLHIVADNYAIAGFHVQQAAGAEAVACLAVAQFDGIPTAQLGVAAGRYGIRLQAGFTVERDVTARCCRIDSNGVPLNGNVVASAQVIEGDVAVGRDRNIARRTDQPFVTYASATLGAHQGNEPPHAWRRRRYRRWQ